MIGKQKVCFTRNVITRNNYFKKNLQKYHTYFDQVLVLGVGLDTKFDELDILVDKPIFALDIQGEHIRDIYQKAGLTSQVHIIDADFNQIEQEAIQDTFIKEGLDIQLRTILVWEGGTFYLTPADIFSLLSLVNKTLNVVGLWEIFLTKSSFQMKRTRIIK
ncbi:class I SAM-dependent methyltransferase [Listeria fleischmannii]|uniref:Methyltransferase, putative, TIGR00027 family protein n=1 Tax=Listeria fleischmannii FSL S10-1203 TaxID=1265822 RepID=W7DNY8_9LIST|nr:class I SAM-dependent methyltransferase [Listeria fleischmannii]EUJ47038.1 methyltransferase, putative, TIGR00027 family protein [Listeria fleischmannii FSL S10-1203]